MKAIARERRTAAAKAAQDGQSCVEKWKAGEDNWKERQRICGSAGTKGVEGEKSERESENGATRIVRNYLFKVFEKLGISNRVELVLYCVQQRQSNDAALHAEARPQSAGTGILSGSATSSVSQLRSSGSRRERMEQTSRSGPASDRSEIR